MSIASDKSVFEMYPDGSKCTEYINDLSETEALTWEAVYWRAKYLYTYGRDVCENSELVDYLNECFNQGLSVNANQELYMDARKMQSALYILEEDFKMASNCIQAVLDITEDIPAEMFLDLTYAEIHTDLFRILKSPVMFFNDLHTADSDSALLDRQKQIIKKLLIKAAEAKNKDSDIAIDNASIEKEVIAFGLTASEEYGIYKKVIAGESVSVVIPASEKVVEKKPVARKKVAPKPAEKSSKGRNKAGLLEIVIFPEDEPEEEKPEIVEEVKPKTKRKTKAKVEEPEEKNETNLDLKGLESMLSTIMATVSENSKQIANLQGRLQSTADDTEVEQIKAELEQGEAKNKELIAQLEATKAQLAESEKEKSELAQTVETQNAILEEKKSAEFTEEELAAFANFERVIVIDTCSLEHQPDLLEYLTDKEMLRVSKIVVAELENHKKYLYDKEKQKMGQAGLKAIKKAIKTSTIPYACDYEDSYTSLLPALLQIKSDDEIGTVNDKEIFSVAMRYKLHSNLPVVIISDDTTIQVMAQAEHIESMSAEEFISGKVKIVKETPAEVITEDDFLAKKLKCKEYSLSQHEVLVLQGCGIKTVGDLLSKTESDLAFIKDKKGISYTARITQVFEKAKRHYDSLFGVAETVESEED